MLIISFLYPKHIIHRCSGMKSSWIIVLQVASALENPQRRVALAGPNRLVLEKIHLKNNTTVLTATLYHDWICNAAVNVLFLFVQFAGQMMVS